MKEKETASSQPKMVIKAYSKHELCLLYGVSRKILRGWLKEDDDYLGKTTKNFSLTKVEFIFSKHGYPKNLDL